MASNKLKPFIPPPPNTGPSIAAGAPDPEADAIIDAFMGQQQQTQAQEQYQPIPQQPIPQYGQQSADPEADAIVDQFMGATAQVSQPKGKQNGLVPAPVPAGGPSITRKSTGATKLNQAPPAQPAPYEIAGQQFMQGIGQVGQVFDRGLGRIGNAIGQIPIVGPATQGLAQQANMAQAEHAKDWMGSSVAAVVNAPRGALNVIDNVGNVISRQLSEWGPSVHRNNPPMMNLAGAYDQIPGVKTLQQAYPAQSGTGQAAGASAIPVHTPVPIANPVVRGAVQGGIGGQVLGSIESAGHQARQGPVNYGKAAVEGLPVAAMGAGLGAGIGKAVNMGKALGKGFGKGTQVEPKVETKVQAEVAKTPAQQAVTPDKSADIVLADGSAFSKEQATAHMRDAATPPEVKEELKSLLQAKDEEFANAGMRARPPARETAFTKLGKNPTNADFEKTFREAFANAKDQAEVKQLQADAFSYMTGKIKGPIAKELQTKINAVADQRLNALQPKYIKVENGGLGDNGDVSAQAAQRAQELMPTKVQEEAPLTSEEKLKAEETRLFPYSERLYGKQATGYWRPSELTIEQLNDSLEFMRDGRTLNQNEQLELRGLEQELQRREWRQRQEAEYPDTAIKHEKPAPEAVEERPTEPIAESQQPETAEPKGFFGNTRRLIQGNTGDDVTVRFPTPLERDIFSHASQKLGKQLPADVRSREAAAAELGMTPAEYWEYAKQYANDLKTTAREGRGSNDGYMDAPRAVRKEALSEAAKPPESAAESVQAPAAEIPGNRFITQKNAEKPGGYVDLIDSSTGEVISSSKRTEAQAAALAAKYNDLAVNAPDKLEAELNRGSKNFLDWKKSTDSERAQIVEKGSSLPEGHELSEPMNRLAETKHAFDEARARYDASVDAFYKHIKATQGTTTKRARSYIQEIEDLTATARKAGSDELTLEVNSANKLEPKAPKFQRGMTPEEAIDMVENLHQEMNAREKDYLAARKDVHEPFLKSKLGSVNIPHEKGIINVRPVPKQGTELNATAEMMRGVTEEMNGPIPEKTTPDRSISNARKIAKTRGIRGRGRNQRGSVSIKIAGKKPPPARTVDEALADGMNGSKETSDLANDAEKVRALFTLRNTFDIAKEVSTDLHNELMLGVGKEALAAHDIKFNGEQAALAEASLQLEPWTIREGGTPEIDLSSMSDQQLNYLATRRSIRQRMAESVRDELTTLDTEYGSLDNMPNRVKNQYTTLEQLEQALSGYVPRSGTTEGALLGVLRNAMYDYLFKWNFAYHGLNLVDPFIVGSSRVGLTKIAAAKLLLQTDPSVKAYVKGVPNETPIQAMRKETLISAKIPKGVKSTWYGKGKQAVAKLQSKLPDLPSERWNFEDSWLAGVIERGDRIGYEGGGTQYAKDLAAGKLSLDEQMQLYADSMNTAQEITGSGSFGLNKDTIQRIGPLAKAVTMFTSQPLRQSRIMADIITKDMRTNPTDAAARLLSFAAASTFFGGRALLPREFDLLEQYGPKELRPFFRGVQDFLDNWKLFEKVPIVGRDLTDKLRTSFLPFLGGAQTNILLGEVAKIGRNLEGGKLDEAAKAALLWALSGFVSGGGLEASKVLKSGEAAAKGDRDIYAYPSAYIPATGGERPAAKKKFSQITGQKYTGIQAAKDSLLPGQDPRVGAFIKKARRQKMDKKK